MPTLSVGATTSVVSHLRFYNRSLTVAAQNRRFRAARVSKRYVGHHTRGGGLAASRARESGITLIEMLIAVGLVALLAGLTYPSVNAGLDTLRLRSSSDQVMGFLATAVDRADHRQQVVEVQVLMEENALLARTADQSFVRRLQVPDPARIVSVVPPLAGSQAPNAARRFLLYPGGAIPAIGVEIATPNGRRRVIRLDPITGTASAEAVTQ